MILIDINHANLFRDFKHVSNQNVVLLFGATLMLLLHIDYTVDTIEL